MGIGIVGAAAIVWLARSGPATGTRPLIPGETDRSVVEVLNGTRVDGLARSVTRQLRRQGIDVVYFGTATDSSLDSTQIVIRRGDSSAALRVRKVLGLGRIVSDPDPTRLLDATVLLGPDAAGLRRLNP